MRNVKLIIEYEGTSYCGWQIQNRRKVKGKKQNKTIQQTLEKALSQILQEKIRVIASGRTDAGVHAQGQVANFKTKSKLNCENIQKALNSVLPENIRIKQAEDARADFHARFSVQSKLYRYTIVSDSYVSPHLYRYAHLVKYPLDVKKMRQAAPYLLGRHNLRSFQAVDKRERHPARPGCSQAGGSVRTIKRLGIHNNKNIIYLDIEADGFLYRMVRNIVGTLIEVGRGRLKPQDIERILKVKNRIYAGPCAPARGLTLVEVKY